MMSPPPSPASSASAFTVMPSPMYADAYVFWILSAMAAATWTLPSVVEEPVRCDAALPTEEVDVLFVPTLLASEPPEERAPAACRSLSPSPPEGLPAPEEEAPLAPALEVERILLRAMVVILIFFADTSEETLADTVSFTTDMAKLPPTPTLSPEAEALAAI